MGKALSGELSCPCDRSDLALFCNTHSDRQYTIFHGILVSVILKCAEFQIREDNGDNLKIICLISQQIHML